MFLNLCSGTRFINAKNSAKEFVDNIFDFAPNGQIALIKFAGTASVVSDFVGNGNRDYLKQKIDNLELDDFTYHNEALKLIKNGELSFRNDIYNKNKILIMLTDGQPEVPGGYNTLAATKTAETFGELVEDGYTIYNIGYEVELNTTAFYNNGIPYRKGIRTSVC